MCCPWKLMHLTGCSVHGCLDQDWQYTHIHIHNGIPIFFVLVLVWFVGSLEMLIVLEIDWVVFVTCMWGLFDSVLPCSNCFIFQIRSQRDSDPVPYLYLPDELVLLIFSFLPHKDLVSCSRVCWQFYRISMDESLCKSCLSFFMFLPLYCHWKN